MLFGHSNYAVASLTCRSSAHLTHTQQITASAWMPDGESFVSGRHGRKIYEWYADTGERTVVYNANDHANEVAVFRDRQNLITQFLNKCRRLAGGRYQSATWRLE